MLDAVELAIGWQRAPGRRRVSLYCGSGLRLAAEVAVGAVAGGWSGVGGRGGGDGRGRGCRLGSWLAVEVAVDDRGDDGDEETPWIRRACSSWRTTRASARLWRSTWGRAGYACTQAFSGTEARLVLGRRARSAACASTWWCATSCCRACRARSMVRLVRASRCGHAHRGHVGALGGVGQDRPAQAGCRRLPGEAVRPGRADWRASRCSCATAGDAAAAAARRRYALRAGAVGARPRGAHAGLWTARRCRSRARSSTSWSFWPRIRRRCTRSRSCSSWPGASRSPPDDSTVSVHVSNIRAKLKPTGTEGYIQTVVGPSASSWPPTPMGKR